MDEKNIEMGKAMMSFEKDWEKRTVPPEEWVSETHYYEQKFTESKSYIRGWLAAKQDKNMGVDGE